jgi:hypothetical protein
MPDEINFLDLMAISSIGPETVVEKFGSIINSSFFDASNFLGNLKIKGLVDFTTSFPGQSLLIVTPAGSTLLKDADEKSKLAIDALDMEILRQLSRGKRSLTDLAGAINVAQTDLAMHLYRLYKQDYLVATFRNATLDMALTEKGFIIAKPSDTAVQTQQAPSAGAAPGAGIGTASSGPSSAAPPAAPKVDPLQEIARIKKAKAQRTFIMLASVIIVIIILVVILLKFRVL